MLIFATGASDSLLLCRHPQTYLPLSTGHGNIHETASVCNSLHKPTSVSVPHSRQSDSMHQPSSPYPWGSSSFLETRPAGNNDISRCYIESQVFLKPAKEMNVGWRRGFVRWMLGDDRFGIEFLMGRRPWEEDGWSPTLGV